MLAIERKLMVIKDQLPTKGLILNLGSAGGNNYQFFPVKPDLKVISLDLDYRPQGLFIQGDAIHLPFKSGLFDHVVVLDVMEHIPDDKSTIQEIARVIKPSGELFITTPCTTLDFFIIKLPKGRDWETIFKDWGHVRYGYTTDELTNLISPVFETLHVERFGATWACAAYHLYYSYRWYNFWNIFFVRWFLRAFLYLDKWFCKGRGYMMYLHARRKPVS